MKKVSGKYNLDNLREIVRNLEEENTRLKQLLDQHDISYESNDSFNDDCTENIEYDNDQGSRIIEKEITKDLANRFFYMFWGR